MFSQAQVGIRTTESINFPILIAFKQHKKLTKQNICLQFSVIKEYDLCFPCSNLLKIQIKLFNQ